MGVEKEQIGGVEGMEEVGKGWRRLVRMGWVVGETLRDLNPLKECFVFN